jgi:hypothetical protein
MPSVPLEFSTLVEKKCFSCKRSTAPGLVLFPPLGLSACLCRDCGKRQEFSLITKTDALKTYVLTDRDLEAANLMYVSKPNKRGKYPMKLFLDKQVQALAITKHGNLDRANALREEKDISRQSKKTKLHTSVDLPQLNQLDRLKLLDRGSSYGKRRASAPSPPFHVFLAQAIPHAALLERCDVISGADFSPIASTATLYVMFKLFFSIDADTILRRYSRYCGIAAVASAASPAPAAVASAHATADSIRSLVLLFLSLSLLITVTWPHSSSSIPSQFSPRLTRHVTHLPPTHTRARPPIAARRRLRPPSCST